MSDKDLIKKDWPHAPVHRIDSSGIYIVTAATLYKQHLFADATKLTSLEDGLLSFAKKYDWQLEAWAVFSHYHFVARNTNESASLREFLRHLHADSARELNRVDGTTGRMVWFNFWDTRLTYERSYLARLGYVHQNPVRHGLVSTANRYPWCSAAWFERTASPSTVKTIYGFKTDNLNVYDEF